jgi:hypothetical protein
LSQLSACGGEVRPFLIVEKGDNEWFGEQSSVLGRDNRTGCRSPGIFWDALSDYRELTGGEVVAGTPEDFAFAVFGLVVTQSAYWYARRLQPQIPFRHRVVLGHVLLCVSKVSFFFVSALATVACLIIGSDRNLSSGN